MFGLPPGFFQTGQRTQYTEVPWGQSLKDYPNSRGIRNNVSYRVIQFYLERMRTALGLPTPRAVSAYSDSAHITVGSAAEGASDGSDTSTSFLSNPATNHTVRSVNAASGGSSMSSASSQKESGATGLNNTSNPGSPNYWRNGPEAANNGYNTLTGTSSTSNTVASSGTITFATQTGKNFGYFGHVVTATESGGTATITGTITYSGSTLTMVITGSTGAGTFTSWTLQQTDQPGNGVGNSQFTGNALDDIPNSPGPLERRLYTIIDTLKAKGVTVDAIPFSHGTTDEGWVVSSTNANTYQSIVASIRDNCRTHSGNSKLLFSIYRIGWNNLDANNGLQVMHEIQTRLVQADAYTIIATEEVGEDHAVAGVINNCTADGNTGTITSTDTNGVNGAGENYQVIDTRTGIKYNITAVDPGNTYFVLNGVPAAGSGFQFLRLDNVHLKPGQDSFETLVLDGTGSSDMTKGFWSVMARAVGPTVATIRAIDAGLTNFAKDYGPKISLVTAQSQTTNVRLRFKHDLGTTLTTRNGAISSKSIPFFQVQDSAGIKTITNVAKFQDINIAGINYTDLDLTVSTPINDGTVQVWVANGAMNRTEPADYPRDDSDPVYGRPIQVQSPVTDSTLVITAGLGIPSNTVQPSVSGLTPVGSVLSVTNGSWTENPTSFAYQWRRNGTAISGATSSTYTTVSADSGNTIDATVVPSNATGSAAPVASVNAIIAGVSFMNSVQQVTLTIAGGATTGTATISSVGSLAFIGAVSHSTGDTSTSSYTTEVPRVFLTNSTTVTATRIASSSQPLIVTFPVFDPTSNLVDTIQTGATSIASGATTATSAITAVDLTRSVVFFNGQRTNQSTHATGVIGSVELTNSTTVTGTVGAAVVTSSTSIAWTVVQFKAAAIKSLQSLNATYSNSNTFNVLTLGIAVTVANTMTVYGGQNSSTDSYTTFMSWGNVDSPTTYKYRRIGNSGNSYQVKGALIEFVPGVLNSLQAGSILLSATASATATINGVDATKSAANFTGMDTSATSPAETFTSLALTNGTTLTAAKATAGTAASTVGYQVVAFN